MSSSSSFRKYLKYLIYTPKLYRIYPHAILCPSSESDSRSTLINSKSTASSMATSNATAASSTASLMQMFSAPTRQYMPTFLESITDMTLTYVLPMTLLLGVYNRKLGYLQLALLIYVGARVLRNFGRLVNPDYLKFLRIYEGATIEDSGGEMSGCKTEALSLLSNTYDYEFSYFPIAHSTSVCIGDTWQGACSNQRNNALMWYSSWGMAHSIGIRLIYPGLIFGGLLRSVLEEGRGKLVGERGGVRRKVRAWGDEVGWGNGGYVDVDVMVFDNRREDDGRCYGDENGEKPASDILFICCEGNAGFYEIGMIGGALSEGYSVLGWNHPGFGGSTGTPYPHTELSAALGVMDYAINGLGFKEEDIVLYGWSIGGFPASFLASRYPNIRGLLLDATFDDILPLAIPRMPEFMSGLVVATIRNHVNLDNKCNVRHYKGPIRIVRRVEDEIIADPPGVLKANRGNPLLIGVVVRRYLERHGGNKVSDNGLKMLREWVEKPHDQELGGNSCSRGGDELFDSLGLREYNKQGTPEVEELIGIASSILRDYKSTHCTPLPGSYYRINGNTKQKQYKSKIAN